MSAEKSSTAIAIAGIVATVITSLGSIYFVYKQQTAPFQQQLYAKQIDIVAELSANSQVLVRSVLKYTKDKPQKGLEVVGVEKALSDYERTMRTAGVVLPTSIYTYATSLTGAGREMLLAISNKKDQEQKAEEVFLAASILYVQSRAFLGADTLSQSTASLYDADGLLKLKQELLSKDSKFGKYFKDAMSGDSPPEE